MSFVIGLMLAPAAMADDPSFLALSAGGFDVNDNETAAEARIEFRWNRKFLGFKPMIGLLGNSKGGIYGYGGINFDVYLGRRWVLMPNFAVGGYRRGASKNLGNVLEFRSLSSPTATTVRGGYQMPASATTTRAPSPWC